jgi:acetoin utilization protein AcuB
MRRKRIRHLVVLRRGQVCGIVSERDLGGRDGESIRREARVGDRMTETTVTIRSDATASQAANLMRGRVIGCLPVVDGDRLCGIVTTSDLLALVGRGRMPPLPRSRATERGVLPRRGPRRGPRSIR